MTATTTIKRFVLGLMVFGSLAAATLANADATDPFIAHFDIKRGSLGLGDATFELTTTNKPDCYVYTGHAKPNTLAKLFIGRITEKSRFCVNDGQIRPSFFKHHEEGEKDDSYTLRFDWSEHVVHYENEEGERRTMAIGDQALDPLSLQIAARRQIDNARNPAQLGTQTFTLVDEDQIKSYKLRVEPASQISVPAGSYSVLRIKRIGSDDPLKFWLAKNADWIPVRIERSSGSKSFQMNMRRLLIHGHDH